MTTVLDHTDVKYYSHRKFYWTTPERDNETKLSCKHSFHFCPFIQTGISHAFPRSKIPYSLYDVLNYLLCDSSVKG